MEMKRSLESWPGLSYFSYAGGLIAILLAVNVYAGLRGRTWDAALMWQVLAVFFAMAVVTAMIIALETGLVRGLGRTLSMAVETFASFDRAFPQARIIAIVAAIATATSALYTVSALAILFDPNQRLIAILFLVEALIIIRLRPLKVKRATLIFLPACITSSCAILGLTPSSVVSWLLNGLVMTFSTVAIIQLETGFMQRESTHSRMRAVGAAVALAACILYLIVTMTLAVDSHRRFVVVVALIQALAITRIRPLSSKRATFFLLSLCVTSWCLVSGLTYTNFGDWILNGRSSGLSVLAFVASMALVLVEICGGADRDRSRPGALAGLAAATLIFAAFAFRSDHMLDSWIPYHRSFVADVAQLIRHGYWLLWDTPSQYGFLSVLTVAILPTKDVWQALFLLSGSIITIESLIIYVIWRWDRSGWRNGVFAIVVTLAAFGENLSRYPFGVRLYPQGSLRFQWVIGLLFVAFLLYVWRDQPRRVLLLRWCGHAIWLVSLFWSFEAAVWSTVIWVPYLVVAAFSTGLRGAVKRLLVSSWPIAILPFVALFAVDLFYRVRLGHDPDFFGYVEFTGAFVSGSVRGDFPLNPDGAGWSIILALVSAGCLVVCLVREHRYQALPLIVATWLAVWSTSTYFAVEPFDGHVALLVPVLICAAAIVAYVAQSALRRSTSAFFATAALCPLLIICIALMFGEPNRFFGMVFPFTPAWTSDTLQALPPIPKELQQLTQVAGIQPGDPVLITNGPFWTEIAQGMIFPITRNASRDPIEYLSWLPMSPVGIEHIIMDVPVARRSQYIERHLDRTLLGGWYITYRKRADCSDISPRLTTERTFGSTNFSASYCSMHAQANDASRTGS